VEQREHERPIERKLAGMEVGIEAAIPLAVLRTAIGDHVGILIFALMAMAAVMAVVGMLGLGSTMSVNVVERTRELAVMKTIGATPGRITRMVVAEALFVGGLSFALAFTLSVPLTLLVDRLVGNLGFLAPLPLALVPGAALLWLALIALFSPLTTLLPARRAASLTVREALAES
jgi:putative ABC transport system permease protein